MSAHFFDVDVAIAHGVGEAIFMQSLAFWIEKNAANNKHIYDGSVWTYNSQAALLKLFPYWSRKNLRTIIDSCVEQGLVKIGNYNKASYDRTNWYSFTDLGLLLFPIIEKTLGRNRPIEVPKPANRSAETGHPIPDNKPDNKPDNNHHSPPEEDVVADVKKTKKKVANELKVKLIDIYHEIFPDNPRHMTKVIAGDLDKVLTKFINKDYKLISKSGSEVTEENFRTLLLAMKERAPNWTMASYKTSGGRTVTNSLVNFLRFDNITRFMEGRMT